MLRTFILSLFAFLCLHTAATAEITEADRKQIDQKVDTFFMHFNEGDMDATYKGIFIEGVYDNPNIIKNLINQTKTIYEYYSSPVKWVLSKENTEADILIYRTYIILNDKAASRLRIVYQKTSKGWYVNALLFSDITVLDAEE